MNEAYVLPEMLVAGLEALRESREDKSTEADTAIAVYLAMEAVRRVAMIRVQTVH